jgi:predicted P-loop ATPase
VDKATCIKILASAGYPLIPLRGKIPLEENWEHTPLGKHSEKTLLNHNYGVCLGPTDLVIDVDPRNFNPPGDDPMKRLAARIGGFTKTFTVKTGGGGYHMYYKKPATLLVRNSLPEFPGVEFKAGPGRQVVGPGSIHPDSKRLYEVVVGMNGGVPVVPHNLTSLIERKAPTFEGAVGTGEYQDDEQTRSRYQDWLQRSAPISVEGQHGDANAFKVAARGRDFGLSPQHTLSQMAEFWNPRCQPPWADEDLHAKVAHAYLYARGALGTTHPAAAGFDKIESPAAAADSIDEGICKKGWKFSNRKGPDGTKELVSCLQNTLNYFGLSQVGLRGVFGYNDFSRRVEFVGDPPWGKRTGEAVQDQDVDLMRAHLAKDHGYETSDRDLITGMVSTAVKRTFHPVKTFLTTVKWDGTPRLDFWLSHFLGAEDSEYVRAVARKTLCAAVARVFEPGVKFDHVLIIEGRQGVGKSGVCRVLGGEWFSDFHMTVEKVDTVQMMQGKWVVEMAELHTTRKADLDTVKAFLTRQVDEARFAYGRLAAKYPRQGIFIATYNPGPDGTYFQDDENRRWWPVQCFGMPPGNRTFDFDGLKAVRDQLWAEAVVFYRKGEKLTMDTPALQDQAVKEQAQRCAEHPWVERIADWLVVQKPVPDFLTAREIYVGAMGGVDVRFDQRAQRDIAKAMRGLGWEPGFKSVGHAKTTRGYWKRDADRGEKFGVDKVEELW